MQEVGFSMLADHYNVHMAFVAFFKSISKMYLTSKQLYSVLCFTKFWYSLKPLISYPFDNFTVNRSHAF